MSEAVEVLTVKVTAEPMPDGEEIFEVAFTSHPKVTPQWAIEMLRSIASNMERDFHYGDDYDG